METMQQSGKMTREKNGTQNYISNIIIQFCYVKIEYVHTQSQEGNIKKFYETIASIKVW